MPAVQIKCTKDHVHNINSDNSQFCYPIYTGHTYVSMLCTHRYNAFTHYFTKVAQYAAHIHISTVCQVQCDVHTHFQVHQSIKQTMNTV